MLYANNQTKKTDSELFVLLKLKWQVMVQHLKQGEGSLAITLQSGLFN